MENKGLKNIAVFASGRGTNSSTFYREISLCIRACKPIKATPWENGLKSGSKTIV